jgi:crotonobetainyl-CoA:carnitine CoA-transferase CaiB-like acyl-CoA transferase
VASSTEARFWSAREEHAIPDDMLAGVRIIESSMLGPAEMGGLLADLGADVVKVEPPSGDYGRRMTWPIIRSQDGLSENSLLSLHINRGKRSIVIDLRAPGGIDLYLDLVRGADVVIEAMRPGALARRGLTFERMCEVNPRIVFCSISGYGATGPYRDLPSHGIAYDTWAGQVPIETDEVGFTRMGEHTSVGIHAGPLYGALAILAGVLRARSSGQGTAIELAQSDAAAYFDWYRIETWRSYERPVDEVYGNAADGGARRPPGTGGMRNGVRYQIYSSANGHVLFMASEQEFWKNFCTGVGRPELFERWPGSRYGDHAPGNVELQAILTEIFAGRTTSQWIEFSDAHNTPIGLVHTPQSVAGDPQFRHRFSWLPAERLDADMLGYPVKVAGHDLPEPSKAPDPGQHTDDVLVELGYDAEQIAGLRTDGVVS